jgi:cytochrome o ubiquinol oxidase subunit 3
MNRQDTKTTFGFWVYLLTDCVLFAALFAAFAVLRGNTFGGSAESTLFNLPFVLAETLILLTSSFTCGLASLAAHKSDKKSDATPPANPKSAIGAVIGWLSVTFVLGATFLTMELSEFSRLIASGNGPQTSGSLSSFFALVGTHGLHIAAGLLWIAVLIGYLAKRGLTSSMKRKLALFSLFWHFLDIVWIFIFTIVYLYAYVGHI